MFETSKRQTLNTGWQAWFVLLVTAGLLVAGAGTTNLHAKSRAFSGTDAGKALALAANQYLHMVKELGGAKLFPKTFLGDKEGLEAVGPEWWCCGFYPGTLLSLYEATGEKPLYAEGLRMLELLRQQQYNTETHDVGFMLYCSFGHADKIAPAPENKDVLVNGARSLMTRYNPKVGCIKSHNRKPTDYIVIVDNLMNLELLFRATEITGDSSYYRVAVKHADTTLKNHVRADNSIYHALNYDAPTGRVKEFQAGQGAARTSVWARGQAWGVYGFTMAYRFTKDERYLRQAIGTADFMLSHPNMPKDLIPYWDFEAPGIHGSCGHERGIHFKTFGGQHAGKERGRRAFDVCGLLLCGSFVQV